MLPLLKKRKENIEKAIKNIGIKGERIIKAYLRVYEDWCKKHGKPIGKDILFKRREKGDEALRKKTKISFE